jgi:hypothetical protein
MKATSSYLNRTLRTEEQAKRDIAVAKYRGLEYIDDAANFVDGKWVSVPLNSQYESKAPDPEMRSEIRRFIDEHNGDFISYGLLAATVLTVVLTIYTEVM